MKRLALVMIVAASMGCATIQGWFGSPSLQKQLDNTQAALNASCATVTAESADPDWLKTACHSGLHSVLAGQESLASNPTKAQLELNDAVRALGAVKGGK